MKICTKCKENKLLEDFNKRKESKDGHQWWCRKCLSQQRLEHPDRKARNELVKRCMRAKRTNLEFKEIEKQKNRVYHQKQKQNNDYVPWGAKNKDRDNARRRKKYAEDRDRIRAYQNNWNKENQEKMTTYKRDYAREQRATNPQFNIRHRITNRIRDALIKEHQSLSSLELLGCTIVEYKKYLEGLFTEGMTWELFLKAKIHIDHKIPCCSFDLIDPEQQKKCFHYTNTQPLWEKDNLRKISQDLALKRNREKEEKKCIELE